MEKTELCILKKNRLDLKALEKLARRPAPFDGIERSFWNDPYVSQHVLNAHLDPDDDEASRRPETIDASVEWMRAEVERRAHSREARRLLDLGCGPGLYAQRFAAMGIQVSGIDLSAHSIAYARKTARRVGLDIEYRVGDYRRVRLGTDYDGTLIVYGGFSEMHPDDRGPLLRRVREAMKPGAPVFFDVVTRRYADRVGESEGWYVARKHGFWAEGYHLVLEQSLHYGNEGAHLQRFIVILPSGDVRVFSLWRTYYTRESIEELLSSCGFTVDGYYADLTGRPFDRDGEWIGVVAVRA